MRSATIHRLFLGRGGGVDGCGCGCGGGSDGWVRGINLPGVTTLTLHAGQGLGRVWLR